MSCFIATFHHRKLPRLAYSCFKLLLCLGTLGTPRGANALDIVAPPASYLAAKQAFSDAKYEATVTACNACLADDTTPSYHPYCYFFKALAYYHQQQHTLALSIFQRLCQQYPHWEQYYEVRYWQGRLYFEQQQYHEAMDSLQATFPHKMRPAVRQLKLHFLQQLATCDAFEALLCDYPRDACLRQAATQYLAVRPETQATQYLRTRFKLGAMHYNKLPTCKKNRYRIAVFLPFLLSYVNTSQAVGNAFVYDLYRGLTLAAKQLTEAGYPVDLIAYDTRNNPTHVEHLLATDPALPTVDLIIGPLYPQVMMPVIQFAHRHAINWWNPLSENNQLLYQTPFAWLGRPSLTTQLRQASRFLQQAPAGQQVGIIFGNNKKERQAAMTYKSLVEQMGRHEVVLMLEIDPQHAGGFLDAFRARAADVPPTLLGESLQGLTYLCVTSQNELLVSNVLSALAMRHSRPKLLGHARWLTFPSLRFEHLRALTTTLMAPNYTPDNLPQRHLVCDHFLQYFGVLPNTYAYIGYDTLQFVGRMLHQCGVYYQKMLQHVPPRPGAALTGFWYGTWRDNQQVPFLQLRPHTTRIEPISLPTESV